MALMAGCVFCALWAPGRPRLLARMSFFFGLAVNELPFLAFVWLCGATGLLFAEGDADTPSARATIGLAAVTAALLPVLGMRAVRARTVVAGALDSGLGPGWCTALDGAALGRWHRRPPYPRLLIAPLRVRLRGVERIANIRYGPHRRGNLLDVYRSRSAPRDAPILVYFHGGGYFSGRKNREARPLLYRLASQGWVCVSANYRLRPGADFLDHLVDAKRAIAWAHEHGGRYGADTSRVFAAGSSAGAHLVSISALTSGDPAFQPGFEDADTSLSAAICLYGFYGHYYGMRPTDEPASSPLDYLRPDAPPFFVAHGDNDTYVPVGGARNFVTRLRSTSDSPVVYAELPGAQHAFDLFRSIRYEAVVNGVDAFVGWVNARR
ncbi:hypothetical protein E143388_07608 [Rhodococcus opacus]|nr:hypothetical protein E143388_07608 [Rhodococcus opacus]